MRGLNQGMPIRSTVHRGMFVGHDKQNIGQISGAHQIFGMETPRFSVGEEIPPPFLVFCFWYICDRILLVTRRLQLNARLTLPSHFDVKAVCLRCRPEGEPVIAPLHGESF